MKGMAARTWVRSESNHEKRKLRQKGPHLRVWRSVGRGSNLWRENIYLCFWGVLTLFTLGLVQTAEAETARQRAEKKRIANIFELWNPKYDHWLWFPSLTPSRSQSTRATPALTTHRVLDLNVWGKHWQEKKLPGGKEKSDTQSPPHYRKLISVPRRPCPPPSPPYLALQGLGLDHTRQLTFKSGTSQDIQSLWFVRIQKNSVTKSGSQTCHGIFSLSNIQCKSRLLFCDLGFGSWTIDILGNTSLSASVQHLIWNSGSLAHEFSIPFFVLTNAPLSVIHNQWAMNI